MRIRPDQQLPPASCRSVSPNRTLMCLKPDSHNRTEDHPLHMNGAITWHPPFGGDVPRETAEQRFHAEQDSRAVMHSMCTEPCGPDCNVGNEAPFSHVPSDAETELRGWWFDQAEKEIEGTVPKAIEYSSTDLVDIGRVLAYTMSREVTDEEAAELGIFFYLQGKMSRWAGAIKTGKRPSDDTIYDIGVYCRMAQRVRDTGSWPGTKES